MRMKAAVAVALLAGLPATGSHAQQAPAWVEAPTVADMAGAYPAKARAAGVGGAVNLTCTVGREGRPRDCAALGEKPSGYGFDTAAKRLVQKLRTDDPGMANREVTIPVTFDPAVLTGAPTITRPAWAELPSAADFQASFPKTANGVNEVRVALVCTVASGGALDGCAVDREEPAGQGYGQGALALAPKFRVAPWSQDGQPTLGAKVRVPIRYQLTQAPAPKG